MTDKPKNKNRKKSLIISSIVKVLLILLTVSYCCGFYVKLENWTPTFGKLNNVIAVIGEDEDILCKYSCQNGYLLAKDSKKELIIKVNDFTSWQNYDNKNYDKITIQLIKHGKVVGYVTVEVICENKYVQGSAKIVEQKTCNVTLLELGIHKLFSNF